MSVLLLELMQLDFTQLDPGTCYKVLAALVTPRPIAWAVTVDPEGRPNAAPFSFFNCFGSNPPILALAPGNRAPGLPKDTAANIAATREFVVCLVDEELGQAMNVTAAPLPPGKSELEAAGLETVPSTVVEPPRIAAASVAFECEEHTTLEIGGNRLVIGVVKYGHVKDGLLDPRTLRLRPETFFPIGRMASPAGYCTTRDRFEMPLPM